MPRPPTPPDDPDGTFLVRVWVPGWLKAALIAGAESSGLTLSEHCAVLLAVAVREGTEVPLRPGVRELPTFVDVVRSYAVGETLLMPCGERSCEVRESCIGAFRFCETCGIRL